MKLHFQSLTPLLVVRHGDSTRLRLLFTACLTALAALTIPRAVAQAVASLPAATATNQPQAASGDIFSGIDFLPDLPVGSSKPRNGTIVVYRGVDKTADPACNVTAFVNVWGEKPEENGSGVATSSVSPGGDAGYHIVGVYISAILGNGYKLVRFAGYTSFDYTMILYNSSLPVLDTFRRQRELAYIDPSTGSCVNYTETQIWWSDKVDTYFVNDTTTLYYKDSNGTQIRYCNVDLTYVNCSNSSDTLVQGVYYAYQKLFYADRALNATSAAFFDLGPHGPYALDVHGYPVVLRNDAGEALRPLAAAAHPPGKGSVRAWDVGVPTLVVAVLTCLAAAALL